jgi:pyruvate,water dikinase
VAADLADAARLDAGQILVTPLVTPAWLPVLARAAAVVVDGGTTAAHAAIVCRELGVPLVVATRDATRRLLDGETITVDGAVGTVTAG